ncbi:hypothetical protein CFIMG_003808RA [Ceratocystis fimbriata CBS 114723]|uniref:Uncharacterized protein n=1 Tax=Ceratocystis fimbriata CBS 114723 TaxID=1035309 RepID=A0A2C5X441_9PEZI|nr:hypothetical protein CFIMG_003808RA [Ceratocystis fimbriata CBS 114723]
MSFTDPLDGLDSVDWSQLSHAYGPANDIPMFLKQLQSTNQDVCAAAGDALLSSIYHQGSRYSASVEAVPFLYSLISHKQTTGRAFLLYLVTSLAIGHPTWSVPNGVDIEQWQKRIAGLESPGEHSCQLHEFRAYEAVERGLPEIARCLEDESPSIRATAAHALAFFPRKADRSVTALLDLLDEEPTCTVRCTIFLALAILVRPLNHALKPSIIQKLQGCYESTLTMDGADILTKWSSATALIILGSTQQGLFEETRRVLVDDVYSVSLEASIDPGIDFPFASFSLRPLAQAVLRDKF